MSTLLTFASLRRGAFAAALGLGLAGAVSAQEIGREAWYAVPDARGVQLVHVECGADFIDPREIVVEPGVPVELSVRSSEPLEEFVSTVAPKMPVGKQPNKKAFTPTARGRHDIFCKKQGSSDRDVSPKKKGVLHVGNPHKQAAGR